MPDKKEQTEIDRQAQALEVLKVEVQKAFKEQRQKAFPSAVTTEVDSNEDDTSPSLSSSSHPIPTNNGGISLILTAGNGGPKFKPEPDVDPNTGQLAPLITGASTSSSPSLGQPAVSLSPEQTKAHKEIDRIVDEATEYVQHIKSDFKEILTLIDECYKNELADKEKRELEEVRKRSKACLDYSRYAGSSRTDFQKNVFFESGKNKTDYGLKAIKDMADNLKQSINSGNKVSLEVLHASCKHLKKLSLKIREDKGRVNTLLRGQKKKLKLKTSSQTRASAQTASSSGRHNAPAYTLSGETEQLPISPSSTPEPSDSEHHGDNDGAGTTASSGSDEGASLVGAQTGLGAAGSFIDQPEPSDRSGDDTPFSDSNSRSGSGSSEETDHCLSGDSTPAELPTVDPGLLSTHDGDSASTRTGSDVPEHDQSEDDNQIPSDEGHQTLHSTSASQEEEVRSDEDGQGTSLPSGGDGEDSDEEGDRLPVDPAAQDGQPQELPLRTTSPANSGTSSESQNLSSNSSTSSDSDPNSESDGGETPASQSDADSAHKGRILNNLQLSLITAAKAVEDATKFVRGIEYLIPAEQVGNPRRVRLRQAVAEVINPYLSQARQAVQAANQAQGEIQQLVMQSATVKRIETLQVLDAGAREHAQSALHGAAQAQTALHNAILAERTRLNARARVAVDSVAQAVTAMTSEIEQVDRLSTNRAVIAHPQMQTVVSEQLQALRTTKQHIDSMVNEVNLQQGQMELARTLGQVRQAYTAVLAQVKQVHQTAAAAIRVARNAIGAVDTSLNNAIPAASPDSNFASVVSSTTSQAATLHDIQYDDAPQAQTATLVTQSELSMPAELAAQDGQPQGLPLQATPPADLGTSNRSQDSSSDLSSSSDSDLGSGNNVGENTGHGLGGDSAPEEQPAADSDLIPSDERQQTQYLSDASEEEDEESEEDDEETSSSDSDTSFGSESNEETDYDSVSCEENSDAGGDRSTVGPTNQPESGNDRSGDTTTSFSDSGLSSDTDTDSGSAAQTRHLQEVPLQATSPAASRGQPLHAPRHEVGDERFNQYRIAEALRGRAEGVVNVIQNENRLQVTASMVNHRTDDNARQLDNDLRAAITSARLRHTHSPLSQRHASRVMPKKNVQTYQVTIEKHGDTDSTRLTAAAQDAHGRSAHVPASAQVRLAMQALRVEGNTYVAIDPQGGSPQDQIKTAARAVLAAVQVGLLPIVPAQRLAEVRDFYAKGPRPETKANWREIVEKLQPILRDFGADSRVQGYQAVLNRPAPRTTNGGLFWQPENRHPNTQTSSSSGPSLLSTAVRTRGSAVGGGPTRMLPTSSSGHEQTVRSGYGSN